jgi:hypothetical protein
MAVPTSDEKIVEHLEREAPELLEGELDFDALVTKVVTSDPNSILASAKQRKTKRETRKPSRDTRPAK